MQGERQDDADFSGAWVHSPNLEDTRITDGWLRNTDISGYIDGLRANCVEVVPLEEAELDRRFPARVKRRATDPQGLAEAWAMIEDVWVTTVARARGLPEALLYERVDDDWSFVETLRRLVMARDCWLFRMIHGVPRPYHRWGLAGSFLTYPASLGLEYEAPPSLDEVLAVRRERMDAVKETIAGLTTEELAPVCVPPDAHGHPTEPASRFRRLAKDYERLPETLIGLHFVAFVCLLFQKADPLLQVHNTL